MALFCHKAVRGRGGLLRMSRIFREAGTGVVFAGNAGGGSAGVLLKKTDEGFEEGGFVVVAGFCVV